jgi:hypothetical protein
VVQGDLAVLELAVDFGVICVIAGFAACRMQESWDPEGFHLALKGKPRRQNDVRQGGNPSDSPWEGYA